VRAAEARDLPFSSDLRWAALERASDDALRFISIKTPLSARSGKASSMVFVRSSLRISTAWRSSTDAVWAPIGHRRRADFSRGARI
jgi:hypothetical protein